MGTEIWRPNVCASCKMQIAVVSPTTPAPTTIIRVDMLRANCLTDALCFFKKSISFFKKKLSRYYHFENYQSSPTRNDHRAGRDHHQARSFTNRAKQSSGLRVCAIAGVEQGIDQSRSVFVSSVCHIAPLRGFELKSAELPGRDRCIGCSSLTRCLQQFPYLR